MPNQSDRPGKTRDEHRWNRADEFL
jgi:hypothetical protein